MITELLYELFVDTSPVYLYVSVFLSVIGTINLAQLDLHQNHELAHVATRKSHAIRIQAAPVQESIGESTAIMDWIVQKAKRIDAPDDDTDDHTFSFFKTITKKRGGAQCNAHLYSQLLKNIV
ncbi:hypothetical protein GCM10028778_00170 [Barrientosiimonas marina]|uniref:Uncharacterized protein n=1 Tax=Lentibacillus kimchii TaxID=1542911 RepID=A0ABW2URC7_9BACI